MSNEQQHESFVSGNKISQSRKWFFTLNNPMESDSDTRGLPVPFLPTDADGARDFALKLFLRFTSAIYLVGQFERGESGTLHLQFCGFWKRAIRFDTIKRILPRANISNVIDQEGAIAYCQKEDTRLFGPFESGTRPDPPAQGKRSDLSAAVETAKATLSLKRVAQDHPEAFIRYARGFSTFITTLEQGRDPSQRNKVVIYYGIPGSGKTWSAHDQAKQETTTGVYIKPPGRWWDQYEGQDTVIFDDFTGDYPYHELLKVLDRYECRVEYKGGIKQLTAKTFYLTSNKHPEIWYDEKIWKCEGVQSWEDSALARRVTTLTAFKTKYVEVTNTSPDSLC